MFICFVIVAVPLRKTFALQQQQQQQQQRRRQQQQQQQQQHSNVNIDILE